MGNHTILPGNRVDTTHSLLDLSTEVLVDFLAYLPPADMISVQRTCRIIRDIVNGTAYLQYILHTQIKGIEDFLPHDFPYSERLALLRRHEQSWSGLQFNLFTKYDITELQGRLTLQGGYLIMESHHRMWIEYRYTDLCTAVKNEELRWVHVKIEHCRLPVLSEVMFSVDHDLVIAKRKLFDISGAVGVEFDFFEFTTGAPHPLAAAHTVSLPPSSRCYNGGIRMQVIGDHILVSGWRDPSVIALYLISWKTGIVTTLCEFSGIRRSLGPGFVAINTSLIALIREETNGLEICKLEINPPGGPRLQSVCFLELTPLMSGSSVEWAEATMEWVPTSRHYGRSRSFPGCPISFYSSAVGTIGFGLHYFTPNEPGRHHAMYWIVISVAGLLSIIQTGVRSMRWVDWGPSITHFFSGNFLMTAGPFWITNHLAFVVRDYGITRVPYAESTVEDTSSLHSRPRVYLTAVFDTHWEPNKIETHLPHRELAANRLGFSLRRFSYFRADREWFIGIIDHPGGERVKSSGWVYHVG